jgi:multiple sugar transport system permease protein
VHHADHGESSRGDIYRTEYGSVYLALSLTVLPLFVFYFVLSKYIIGGVALGALKE